jgi:hypothetical protein
MVKVGCQRYWIRRGLQSQQAHIGWVCVGVSRDDCHVSQQTERGTYVLNMGSPSQESGSPEGTKSRRRKPVWMQAHSSWMGMFFVVAISCGDQTPASSAYEYGEHTSNSPESFKSASLDWGGVCILGLSFLSFPASWTEQPVFPSSAACRWLLWDCPASDKVSTFNKLPDVIIYTLYWSCSSREPWVMAWKWQQAVEHLLQLWKKSSWQPGETPRQREEAENWIKVLPDYRPLFSCLNFCSLPTA